VEDLAMDMFIYFSEPLGCGLDEIEDALDGALDGIGEVTGSGVGKSGSNLDIRIKSAKVSQEEALGLIRDALSPFNLPKSSRITIGNKQYPIES
jgi:hypothetical protein